MESAPLHYLEFVAPGNNDTLRLGVSGNDVYILGQSNVVDTNLVFGAGFLPGPFFLFLLGEYLPGCFDNIQLLAVLLATAAAFADREVKKHINKDSLQI